MASDGTLSGTTSSKRGTTSIISGYLSGDKFTFTINIPIEGNPADVVFSGTLDGNSVKGTIDVMGYSIEFTGTKPTTQAAAIAAPGISGRPSNDSSVAGGAL
jgi:hypothetical protein